MLTQTYRGADITQTYTDAEIVQKIQGIDYDIAKLKDDTLLECLDRINTMVHYVKELRDRVEILEGSKQTK